MFDSPPTEPTHSIDYHALIQEALGDFRLSEVTGVINLPALPIAVSQFAQKAKDEETSIRELARIVETDTGLTIELLKHVNCSYVGLRNKATSVAQALALLGRRQSTYILISKGLEAAVRARKSKLINQTCFWNASLQKALFAREVATLLNTDSDTAFAGSIVQDFLLPVVTNDYLVEYVNFVENRATKPTTLVEYEQQTFGWDHALVAAALAYKWHLPDEMICSLLFHHRGLELLSHPQLKRSPMAAVAISALLPDQLRQHKFGLEELQTLQSQWEEFDIMKLALRVDEIQKENDLGVKNDFPLSRRCQPVANTKLDMIDGILTHA